MSTRRLILCCYGVSRSNHKTIVPRFRQLMKFITILHSSKDPLSILQALANLFEPQAIRCLHEKKNPSSFLIVTRIFSSNLMTLCSCPASSKLLDPSAWRAMLDGQEEAWHRTSHLTVEPGRLVNLARSQTPSISSNPRLRLLNINSYIQTILFPNPLGDRTFAICYLPFAWIGIEIVLKNLTQTTFDWPDSSHTISKIEISLREIRFWNPCFKGS